MRKALQMTLRELRILPPIAIGRLGSADIPVANYTTEDAPVHPLNFRRITPRQTLRVDEATGEVHGEQPSTISFKSGLRIRPVAPFLEVFAVIGHPDGKETIEPLTV